jgi:iron(III) transport system ATP-binding protein
MLSIDHLWVRYRGVPAVRDLNLTLAPGEIVTLVGPTGCGKTTTLRVVAGLESPSEGRLTIGDRTIEASRPVPPEKRRVGLVFQDFALFPHLTVEQNIGFRLRDRGPVEHWLERLGLTPYRRALPETLSGGQKQRVALARTLAHDPALVLLDEPLSNLDAALKASLRWEIRDALKAAGVPALWVTHDQAEALSVGDRVGVMEAGRLAQIDTPEACFQNPADRFVATFLGEAGFVPGIARAGAAETVIGRVPMTAASLDTQEVDVLVRPDDLAVIPSTAGNAQVLSGRFEGETRLYHLRLDAGPTLEARVNHTVYLAPETPVEVRLVADHPLAAFPREPAAVVD